MKQRADHQWQVDPKQAVLIQKQLREKIRIEPFTGKIRWVAGADISFNRFSDRVYAAFVVLDFDTLEIVDRASAVVDVDFPYIPGLLSFREIPPLLQAWQSLKAKPDIVVADGHGIAHPRRLGIATHLGLTIEVPTVGCAKSRLTGQYREPALTAGAWSDLMDKEEKIGIVLRTKNKVKPVFVSPGHRMDFEGLVDLLLKCTRGYRIPEPTRQAHLYVNELRRQDSH